MEQQMKFAAVLFDCDGVLVDSEGITNQVLHAMLRELGWNLSAQDCQAIFLGRMVKDQQALIEKNTGQAMTEVWLSEFRRQRDLALSAELVAIPNAVVAVQQVHAHYAGRIACASGADRIKIDLQLRKVGLMDCFEGRIFSGHEMPRSKPFPDVYLAAAEALGVAGSVCAVVEDTVVGARAGVAAGATVFGYCPPGVGHSAAQQLLDVGVSHVFSDMAQLPGLLRLS
jgi:HAD superfamily hydrolase (TIGR01509 family)